MFTEQQAVAIVEEAERALHLEEITLAAGQVHTVKLQTGEYGGTFDYYWKSYKADVGFQVVFTPLRPSRSRHSVYSAAGWTARSEEVEHGDEGERAARFVRRLVVQLHSQ